MLQGEDGSLTVWNQKEDELETLLLNGICDFDSVEKAESDEHVIHSSTPSVQLNTLNESSKSVSLEDQEDDTGDPSGAGGRGNLVHSTSQSSQKNTQSIAVTKLTRLLQSANLCRLHVAAYVAERREQSTKEADLRACRPSYRLIIQETHANDIACFPSSLTYSEH